MKYLENLTIFRKKINVALYIVKKLLSSMGTLLCDLNMPEPIPLLQIYSEFANLAVGYIIHDNNNERIQCESIKVKLNTAQRRIFDRVEYALLNNE